MGQGFDTFDFLSTTGGHHREIVCDCIGQEAAL